MKYLQHKAQSICLYPTLRAVFTDSPTFPGSDKTIIKYQIFLYN